LNTPRRKFIIATQAVLKEREKKGEKEE